MNIQLSDLVFTHVIITYSKIHHFITQEEEEGLRTQSLGKQIRLRSGDLIATNNIAEIISMEKYYKAFPDKRPTREITPFEYENMSINDSFKDFSKERRLRALEKMKKGFLNVYEGKSLPTGATQILKDMEFRIGTIDW